MIRKKENRPEAADYGRSNPRNQRRIDFLRSTLDPALRPGAWHSLSGRCFPRAYEGIRITGRNVTLPRHWCHLVRMGEDLHDHLGSALASRTNRPGYPKTVARPSLSTFLRRRWRRRVDRYGAADRGRSKPCNQRWIDFLRSTGGDNRAISVPGVGSTKPFSALVVNLMPDLELISKGQCFPRYRYRQPTDAQGALPGVGQELERIDNVTDTALRAFRVRYNDNSITKDGIFDYVYGVLHAPGYRERFANDLAKELPRLPLAHDFHAFARAGRELAELHLGYETCQEYPLDVTFTQLGEPRPEQFRVGERAMRYSDNDRTVLIVNDHLRLGGIPPGAHQYQVNGADTARVVHRPLPNHARQGKRHRQRSQLHGSTIHAS